MSRISISLKGIALTGEFGPVKIGMSKVQVIELLGEPDDDWDFGTGYTGLSYGWYEFFFETDTGILESFQNDHLQSLCSNHSAMILFKNESFEIDIWFLQANHGLTRKEVKEILRQQRISFTEEVNYGNKILRFESGVYLEFDNRDNIWVSNEDGAFKQNKSVVIVEPESYILNSICHWPNLKIF